MWVILLGKEGYQGYWNGELLILYRSLSRAFLLVLIINIMKLPIVKLKIAKIINSDPFRGFQMIKICNNIEKNAIISFSINIFNKIINKDNYQPKNQTLGSLFI